ncbi:hypothetical protein [Sporolactobacillus nakayamae]
MTVNSLQLNHVKQLADEKGLIVTECLTVITHAAV